MLVQDKPSAVSSLRAPLKPLPPALLLALSSLLSSIYFTSVQRQLRTKVGLLS